MLVAFWLRIDFDNVLFYMFLFHDLQSQIN